MRATETSSLLPRFSVTRPVTVTMGLIALLVLGSVAYFRLPVQLLPSGFTPRVLSVHIGYPNATPQESDHQIARPLEEMLRTVKGIDRIRTSSGSWGVSARLDFRRDTDMDLAYNQLMDRLERLKPRLPEEARDNIRVWKHNEDDDSVLWVGVALDPAVSDAYTFLERCVQRRLERIDGVAKVEIWGAEEKAVMVEVDRERAQARGVGIYDLVRALRADNFALTGGYVSEGGKRLYVRSLARYQSLGEMEALPIATRHGIVRLRDVADVVYDVPERTYFQRIDGKPAVSIGVFRESGANIVAVCDRVQAALRRIEAFPEAGDTRFNILFSQGHFIRDSIRNLQATALWGGLFAALVLFFFLRAMQMTAIITLSIPLCVMVTMTALYFIGWSLNLLTMLGLMVGVGMVVDNAIVVVENIYRMRSAGTAARQAAVLGAGEVAQAVTMATLTTAVVFLPLMLMSDRASLRFYLIRVGVPVIVALLGSLLVALLLIPLATVRLGGHRLPEDSATICRIRGLYARSLGWALRHRADVLLVALATLLTVYYPIQRAKRTDRTRENLNDVSIRVYPENNLSLQEVRQVMADLEAFIEGRRARYGIRTFRVDYRKTYGRVRIFLEAGPDRPWWRVAYEGLRAGLGVPLPGRMDRAAVIKDLKRTLPRFVGARLTVEGFGTGGAHEPSVAVYFYGEDVETLAGLSAEAERRFRSIPSVVGVDSDLERANDEVRVHIDRARAAKLGLSPQEVAQTLAFGLQGVGLPRFRSDGREVTTRLYLNRRDVRSLDFLRNLTFRSRKGTQIPMSDFAALEVTRGSGTIRRENGKTRLQVRVYAAADDLAGLYREIDRAMEGFELPRGYTWDKGEAYARFRDSNRALRDAAVLAVTFVFLLMGVLFESFVLPFSVLLSIPFALLGVYWTLYLTDTTFDIMAQVGLIVLIGVVVNNAIVLVDRINRRRNHGLGRAEAVIEAGDNRFRPILMTTFTTAFGLLPMAVGNSNMVGIPYAPLGRTIMGGLMFSALLTLFVVPLFYTVLDDLRLLLCRMAAAVYARPPQASHTLAEADGHRRAADG